MIDTQTLINCTGATRANAERYVLHLADGMNRFRIHSDNAVAAFLGQLVIESDTLDKVEEGLYYTTAARLREVFPSLFVQGGYRAEDYLRNPRALSALRYKGFHGRGLIQLTWEDAYVAAGKAMGVNYRDKPELLLQPLHAALSACWVFAQFKDCLPAAERGDVYDITGRINGKARLKLVERKAATARAYKVLSK
ncbi:glycoside hydrolase family 19 protein [Variovorax sp. J22G73]|uniref:glycoside hydrolase family 19 protein n=1 Tax=unclassified Variovorax TaxID=663243 RepID=UPI002577A366|nr:MULTISPECIES: glycoside hydrolase family 19 protein [unclassified Variovorax]MDM0007204.1 glycoside hydrolase family 19 protein [Variovorax sp. J22R203]MDM0099044.1 glycoside hydrolase family 19 protein [Variovorax sp. J22G73]